MKMNSTNVNISFIDEYQQEEVDNFYQACQLHRNQYKDHSGKLHALDFFVQQEFEYQCPPDLTRTYLKFPTYYTQYRHPPVFPRSLERTVQFPSLPDRTLRGRYMKMSDISYKR